MMRPSAYIRLLGLRFIILIGLLLSSCSSKNQKDEREALIAVSIYPLKLLTEELSSGKVGAISLLPLGQYPEHFSPSLSDMQQVGRASYFIGLGDLGFEVNTLPRLQDIFPQEQLRLVKEQIKDYSLLEDDPHLFTSFAGIEATIEVTYQTLCQISPSEEALFTQNRDRLLERLHKLKSESPQRLKKRAVQAFVIYHPMFSQLSEELGLEQLSIEAHGKEPTLRELQLLIERARATQAKVFFRQKEFLNALDLEHDSEANLTEKLGGLELREVILDPLAMNPLELIQFFVDQLCQG